MVGFSFVESMIAWRYLRSRRQEGFVSLITALSFLGILLGVATLIIVMAVMNGFKEQLMKQILGFNGEITVYHQQGRPLTDFRELRREIEKIPGVSGVFPIIEGQAVVSAHGNSLGVKVHGVLPEDLKVRPLISSKMITGSLTSWGQGEGKEAILGKKMAKMLRVKRGDKISLLLPQGNRTPFGLMPKQVSYTVSGIFEVGMIEYDRSFVFIPLEKAQQLFQLSEGVTGLEVFVHQQDHLDQIQQAILRGGSLRTVDWRIANQTFFNAVEVERNVMFLILTLIVVIAMFNVIAHLVMLVKDKHRDIGILRTMGMSRASIMRVFFLTGSSIGVSGTLGGFLVGYGFSKNIETIRQWLEKFSGADLFSAEIYFLSKLPAVVRPMDVSLVVGMSLLLSFLATLYPAWRASCLDPVEALRYGS